MSYSLLYFDEVNLDVKQAKKWYKKQQQGLEKRFAGEIKSIIKKIQDDPFICQIRYRQIRVAHPKVFPYGVHYYINDVEKQIVIVAICHNSRDPELAKSRLTA